jgi:aminoglycoside phosphotransferase (APT) family kinase protein
MLDALTRRIREEWDPVQMRAGVPRRLTYLCVPGSLEGGTTTLLGFTDGQRRPALVVKVHRDPDGEEFVEAERLVLAELGRRGDFLRSSVPAVLFCGPVEGCWVLVESVLDGRPLVARLTREGWPDLEGSRRDVNLVVDWLIECHRTGAMTGPPAGDWSDLALTQMREFAKVFDLSPAEEAYLRQLRRTIDDLRGCQVPLVIRHGDYCRQNILLSERDATRIGVIDWTFSRMVALPLHDLVFFLGTCFLQVRHERGVAALDRMFAYTFLERNSYSDVVADWLARYHRALHIDAELAPVLFGIALIDQALFEYRLAMRAIRKGNVPRFVMFLAASQNLSYDDAPRAQLWRRFFRVFAEDPARLVV